MEPGQRSLNDTLGLCMAVWIEQQYAAFGAIYKCDAFTAKTQPR